jgi:competence protein ComEC
MEPTPFGNDYPDNDGSMVVTAQFPAARFLFTGDGSVTLEDWLMATENVKVNVLKAGHHGSRSSSAPEFLAASSPQYVVLSCGRNNRYGHPNPAVMERLKVTGAKVYRTDRDGDITFWLDGSLRVSHQRP